MTRGFFVVRKSSDVNKPPVLRDPKVMDSWMILMFLLSFWFHVNLTFVLKNVTRLQGVDMRVFLKVQGIDVPDLICDVLVSWVLHATALGGFGTEPHRIMVNHTSHLVRLFSMQAPCHQSQDSFACEGLRFSCGGEQKHPRKTSS